VEAECAYASFQTDHARPHSSRHVHFQVEVSRAIIVPMNIEQMLRELREEREGITQAIYVMERLAKRSWKKARTPTSVGNNQKARKTHGQSEQTEG
jgi:hypothetical protein